MKAVRTSQPLYRRPREIGRRVFFFMLGLVLKAYGVAAVVSVALSDAETVGGKCSDALHAVPNLMERFRQAMYVVDHREQIQSALDYAHQHSLDAQQLDAAVQKSTQTIDRISTTYSEIKQAQDAFFSIRPTNLLDSLPQVKEHVQKAWAARPSPESINQLSDNAAGLANMLEQLDFQDPYVRRLYGNGLSVVDNFASDEIVGTLAVMAAAFTVAYSLGMAAGYWGRRGRPGFIAATLQRWGTRHFSDWYVGNLEYAMSLPLYAVARERIQRDIVADPRKALDTPTLQALERYFELKRLEPHASSGSVTVPQSND